MLSPRMADDPPPNKLFDVEAPPFNQAQNELQDLKLLITSKCIVRCTRKQATLVRGRAPDIDLLQDGRAY